MATFARLEAASRLHQHSHKKDGPALATGPSLASSANPAVKDISPWVWGDASSYRAAGRCPRANMRVAPTGPPGPLIPMVRSLEKDLRVRAASPIPEGTIKVHPFKKGGVKGGSSPAGSKIYLYSQPSTCRDDRQSSLARLPSHSSCPRRALSRRGGVT
jgi:hypothetical protein